MRERVLTKPLSEKLNNINETSSKPSPLVAAIPLYFFLSSSVGRNRSKMSTYSGLSEALSRLFMALQRRSLAKFMRFFEIAKFLRWKNGISEMRLCLFYIPKILEKLYPRVNDASSSVGPSDDPFQSLLLLCRQMNLRRFASRSVSNLGTSFLSGFKTAASAGNSLNGLSLTAKISSNLR